MKLKKGRIKSMAALKYQVSAVVLACVLAAGNAAAKNVRTVRGIEFKGLKLLTKYDLIRSVRLRAVDNGIIIDMESLESALARNAFLASYRVAEKDSRLIITVAEKRPELILAVTKNGKTALYELDAAHAVISRNDVHTGRVPVVVCAAGDMAHGARELLGLLGAVKKKNAAVYREISEVRFEGDRIRVRLRGRKTSFIMIPRESDFIKLRYITGYCDRTQAYPDAINLTGNEVIVR